jgi:hypothetical protein
MRTRLRRTCYAVIPGICNSREEATSSTLHLQLQLSQCNGLVAWHCKVSCEPVCAELAAQSFSPSVTHGFHSAQISLDFDWKWRPPAVQPHHSYEKGQCFSSNTYIPVFQSCETTSVSMFEEVDPFETVLWRPTEHCCISLFSRTQSHKALYGRCYFWNLPSLVVKIGNMEIYRQFWNLWEFDLPLIPVCFVVFSYFIPESVSIIYAHPVCNCRQSEIQPESNRVVCITEKSKRTVSL